MIPISDEQAKAIEEALKTARAAGGYFAEVLGTVPHDIVGLLGGDWLRVKRAENAARIAQKASERLRARNVKPEPASLSIGLPILLAAADESREELQDIWARLLAAAADPGRSRSFRIAFIETARKLDPLDARLLQFVQQQMTPNGAHRGDVDALARKDGFGNDEITITYDKLIELKLLNPLTGVVTLDPFGREFLRAISD